MTPSRRLLLAALPLGVLLAATPARAAVSPIPQTPAGDDRAASAPADELTDAQRDALRLLDIAWDAVSGMPDVPHEKNRSRAQERVVDALVEAGLLDRALERARAITNWRRGAALATCAAALVEADADADVSALLTAARDVADGMVEDQTWRRDHVRARIALALRARGQVEEARALEDVLEPSELGVVAEERVADTDAAAFEAHLEALPQIMLGGQYDQVRNALVTCARAYDRFFDDEALRGRAADAIRDNRTKVPAEVAIELFLDLARAAVAHDAAAAALGFVGEADEIFAAGTWLPEHHVPMAARIASVRFRAGDEERALEEARAARALFEVERVRIYDVFRTEALLPLAHAFHEMGEADDARDTWVLAVLESQENPNSRPRSEDLVSICAALADAGVTPDADLWSRLDKARDGMGDPW